MRTSVLIVCVSLGWLVAAAVAEGQPLTGVPPQPAELVAPPTVPTPPPPGPIAPIDGIRSVPPAAPQAAPAENQAVPAYRQPVYTPPASTTGLPATPDPAIGDAPPDISPNNPDKWRYVYRNGSWWYYTPTKKWLYWSGGRWIQYATPATSNTPAGMQPPATSRRWRRNSGASNSPYAPNPSGSPAGF